VSLRNIRHSVVKCDIYLIVAAQSRLLVNLTFEICLLWQSRGRLSLLMRSLESQLQRQDSFQRFNDQHKSICLCFSFWNNFPFHSSLSCIQNSAGTISSCFILNHSDERTSLETPIFEKFNESSFLDFTISVRHSQDMNVIKGKHNLIHLVDSFHNFLNFQENFKIQSPRSRWVILQ